MKIALFHVGFFYSGGGEKLVIQELKGLRELGHEVTCYAPYIDTVGCYPDEPEIQRVRALLPAPPSWLPMKDPLWILLSCVITLFLAWRFRSYDVLFGANQPGPWIAFVLGRILKKPYITYLAQALRLLHPRNVDLDNGIRIREGDHRFLMALKAVGGFIIDWADRISVRNSDVVFTNGTHVSRWISEVYGVENYSCPAGCHPIPINDLNQPHRVSGLLKAEEFNIPKPFILLTNRHQPMKRFEYALWALKSILRARPDTHLVITGQETEYTDQLRYLVDGLGLHENVHFVGLVSEDKLMSLYKQAAVYVYPSPEEDFGMGVVEAMGSGTPVVAWNNGGPAFIVKDKVTGFLVEPFDTDAFADRILTLLSNPKLAEKLGRAGHKRAEEFFSYSRHNQMLESALASLVEGYVWRSDTKETAVGVPTWVEE